MTVSDQKSSADRPNPSRPVMVGVGVFVVCILITLAVRVSFHRLEREQSKQAFDRHVREQVGRLHEAALNMEARFEGIRTLMEFSTIVTHAEFAGAANRMLKAFPSLDAVEWAPLVHHRDRSAFEAMMAAAGHSNFVITNRVGTADPVELAPAPPSETYLPVKYRVPPPTRTSFLGFNLFTAIRRKALEKAHETGEIRMSTRGQLIDHPAGKLGFVLFLPVFHTIDHPSGQTIERGAFRGMILGVVQLEPFLAEIFVNRAAGPRHELLIEDRLDDGSVTIIGVIDPSGKVVLEHAANRQTFDEPEVEHREINLWGRSLALTFRPVAAADPVNWTRDRVGFLSGLLISGAFGLMAFSLARRSTLVEQQVAERTQELRTIQLQLEHDIAQRMTAEQNLRISEQRYRSLFDQNPDAVFAADLSGRFLSANLGMARLTGYTLAEIEKLSCGDVTAPDSLDRSNASFARAAAGASVNFEHVGLHKDGTRFYASVTELPIIVNGKVVGIYGIAKDIAVVKRATRELESFFDLSVEMMAIAGEDGYLRRVNRAYEQVTGYVDGELLKRPAIEFVHPDDRASTKAELAKLSHDVTSVAFENRIRTKQGDYRTLAWSIRSVPEEGIRYGVAHDVTDRRAKELRLREQASLLDKAQDAILVYDLSFRISYWNKSAERLYGWTDFQASGGDVRELVYRDYHDAFETAHRSLLQHGEWTGELKQTNPEGRIILVVARWTLVRNEAGQPHSVLSIATDITEQKKVEAQLFRVQRVESLGTLASGIAHDLNNVLAPIMMSIGLLKVSNRDPNDLKTLNSIEISAKRGADLVKQILSFARGDEGNQVPTAPGRLFREIANVIHETFPKNIHCDIRLKDEIWPVIGDPTQLHQVLFNLCLNARDAMPRGGTLTLSAENVMLDEQFVKLNREGRPGPHVLLTISDTGTGIPPEIRDKIFDPFFTTKEVGKGTGLGLSMVLTIVRTNNGILRLSSELGRGTRFRIYLPAETVPQASLPPFDTTNYPRGAGELILVVDDEESVRIITRRTLEAFGYRVVLATNGAEALIEYVEHQHDIAAVLTDITMPIMDGHALIRSLVNLNAGVRIIAASGLPQEGAETFAGDANVKEFLPKPYTTATLLETMARVLGRSE